MKHSFLRDERVDFGIAEWRIGGRPAFPRRAVGVLFNLTLVAVISTSTGRILTNDTLIII